jgi:hypothetical protein
MSILERSETQVDRYRQLRACFQEVVSKMYDASARPEFDLLKAARKLTLPVEDETVIFDGEVDTNAFAHFYLREMRFGGKSIADVLADSAVDLTSDERLVLEAYRAARCSLFEVIQVHPAACQVDLHDLLEPGTLDVSFTDISLSNCGAMHPGDLLFTPLVHCDGVYMSGGVFFAFQAVRRIYLLNAYHARMRTVDEKEKSQRTFIFFYQKNREFGAEQEYRDMV